MCHFVFAMGIFMLWLSTALAQSTSTLIGARSGGVGYASACLDDEWSLFNNVGGLAKVDRVSTAFAYDAQPSFKPFNRMAAIVAVPVKFGVGGLGFFRFGDQLYREQIICLGFSNTFGLASLGVKVNYIQYNAQGFGTKGVFSISFGGIAKLTEKISIGAHIINLNQPDISSTEEEKLPTLLILGIGFQVTSQTLITTELEKDLRFPLRWKAGVEYQPFKKFIFRSGFHIEPNAAFFGFGFRPSKFKLDYAYQHSFTVGSRHQATVGYFLNRPQ